MKNLFPLIVILLLSLPIAKAQDIVPKKYRIEFTDKLNAPFSVNQPTEFLSPKSIERRANQNVAITEQDIPVNPQYVQAVRQAGGKICNKLKWFNAVVVEMPNDTVLNEVMQLPFVKDTFPVTRLRRDPDIVKPLPAEQLRAALHEDNEYGLANDHIVTLNGKYLHHLGLMGEGMTIAVIDAGFRGVDTAPPFQPLWQEGRLVAHRNIAEQNDSTFAHSSHGTNVLSLIAAKVPGTYLGTAPNASFLLLRSEVTAFELAIEEDNWVAAAEFADSAGADILTTSLGYTTFDKPEMDFSYSQMDGNTTLITRGADIAASKGMLVINSAGNSGNNSWHFIGAPADGDSVLAVGAVNAEGKKADFSSFGPTSDGRVKPNVMSMGRGNAVINSEGGFSFGSGTSFAAPILSGMAACLWQAFPEKTSMEIFEAIEQSAHLYTNPNDSMGHGIPNFTSAYFQLLGAPEPPAGGVGVFPNPTDGVFHVYVEGNTNEKVTVRVFDLAGRKMSEQEAELFKDAYIAIPVEVLTKAQSGVYIVNVQSKTIDRQVKVVRN